MRAVVARSEANHLVIGAAERADMTAAAALVVAVDGGTIEVVTALQPCVERRPAPSQSFGECLPRADRGDPQAPIALPF